MSNGEFSNKNEEDAKANFDWLAENTQQWVEREIDRITKPTSLIHLKADDELMKQINHLTRIVEALELQRVDTRGSFKLEPKILVSYDHLY